MKEQLRELAARCESADGPSYELETDIADAVWKAKWGRKRPKDIVPGNYTASLDAALTLLPESAKSWNVGGACRKGVLSARPFGALVDYGNKPTAFGEGSTGALALCAAVLRALAGQCDA